MHNEYGDMSSGVRGSLRPNQARANPVPSIGGMLSSGVSSLREVNANPQQTLSRPSQQPIADLYGSARNTGFPPSAYGNFQPEAKRVTNVNQEAFKQFVMPPSDNSNSQIQSYTVLSQPPRQSLNRPDGRFFNQPLTVQSARLADYSPQPSKISTFGSAIGHGDGRITRLPLNFQNTVDFGKLGENYNGYQGAKFVDANHSGVGNSSAAPSNPADKRVSFDNGQVSQSLIGPREVVVNSVMASPPKGQTFNLYPISTQRSNSAANFFDISQTPLQQLTPLRSIRVEPRPDPLAQIAQKNSLLRSMAQGDPQAANPGQMPPANFNGLISPNLAQKTDSTPPPKMDDSFFNLSKFKKSESQTGVPPANSQLFSRGPLPAGPISQPLPQPNSLSDSYFKWGAGTVIPSLYENRERPSVTNTGHLDRPSISGSRPLPRSISPSVGVQSERKVDDVEAGRSRSKSILKKREPGERKDASERKKSVTINEAKNTEMTYKKYLKKMYNSMKNLPADSGDPRGSVGTSSLFPQVSSGGEYQSNRP